MKCRHCAAQLVETFLDLGFAPPSNAYLTNLDLIQPEKYYPLKVLVCDKCWLVQTEDYAEADKLFSPEYAYFSSTSASWLIHAAEYADKVIQKFQLTSSSMVLEVASNDGYLLRNFVKSGIPCLGIEPTASTAAAAEKIGITVIREFFGEQLGQELAISGKQADLIVGNNVYAHVPDINDFTRGLKSALKPGGTITLEFPHLMNLIKNVQFDTIYHEHFSYLSLYTVQKIFQAAQLQIWDVEILKTHGGSLRIYGQHAGEYRPVSPSVDIVLEEESSYGLQNIEIYQKYQHKANQIKNNFLTFLIEKQRAGKKIAAYGAAAKGNTLLNYAGIKPDLIPFVCDAAPAKQGKFMPGSHIPILHPSTLLSQPPDYLVILPWNIAEEIKRQNIKLIEAGTQFVTFVPELKIL